MATHFHTGSPCSICGFPLQGEEAKNFVYGKPSFRPITPIQNIKTKYITKLSDKKIREIENISFVVELIKTNDKYYTGKGSHWTDTPPEIWSPEERVLWDMMFESEYRLKQSIIELFNKKVELTYKERIKWFFDNYYETGMEFEIMLLSWIDYDLDNFEWHGDFIRIPKYQNELK